MTDYPDSIWEDPQAHEEAMRAGAIPAPAGAQIDAAQENAPSMHVFIDDSGDGGFKFDKGSSTHLIMAACVFHDPTEIEKLKALSEHCASSNGHRREFKFNRTKERLKECYFNCTAPTRFNIRAIHADKRRIYSEKLHEGKALKSYLIRMLLTRNFGQIHNARIVIDGQDTQGFGVPDEEYLLKMVNRETPGTIHSVRFRDSREDRGLQAADMAAGAISRALQEGPKSRKTTKYLYPIKPRFDYPMGTIWNFTRNE